MTIEMFLIVLWYNLDVFVIENLFYLKNIKINH